MFDWLKKFLDIGNDRCFEEHKNVEGICYGLMGGDWSTDYLSETCVSCKHHTMPHEAYRKGNNYGKR